MVIIAFQKFGVKGRHKDFPFASPSAQNGSAWPDDCPKKKNSKRVPANFGCALQMQLRCCITACHIVLSIYVHTEICL